MDKASPILVTGTAGFIGFHLAKRLLSEGYTVVGIDSLNNYYDVNLKIRRNELLQKEANYSFVKAELADVSLVKELFNRHAFKHVVHLAAQAGVRYSLINPYAYIDANLSGFLTILEECKRSGTQHLLYASSSSVYGANTQMPFKENDSTNHPVSLYAATKKANEMMAHAYSSSFKLPVTGLRFFTVYGPWGRPDMALFLFTKAILNGEPIAVFNNGEMMRDFTYVDDIVESIYRLLPLLPEGDPHWDSNRPNPSSSSAPYRIYNIGNNAPVKLMDFVHAIEKELGTKAIIDYQPLQVGDVPKTYADASALIARTKFAPSTSITKGVHEFIKWYKEYYK